LPIHSALLLLGLIFIFYTIPLTAAAKLANPEDLGNLLPKLDGVSDEKAGELTMLLSGLLTAGIWSSFFALCPILFKVRCFLWFANGFVGKQARATLTRFLRFPLTQQTIANFGSKANSVANAEFKALQYFWWFMVLTAFTGQLLANMALSALNEGLSIGTQIQEILRTIAKTIPSQISVNWLNWIIFRFTIILPLNYLLQVNTFLFNFLGMHCCSRLVQGKVAVHLSYHWTYEKRLTLLFRCFFLNPGGGPGGPVPYRIYIDSGVVLMW